MSAVLSVVLLGLLARASAAPPPPSCDDVIRPLRRDQLDKVLGSWVLVGTVSDDKSGLLPTVGNSFMELSLSEDNSTFIYIERNKLRDETCVWYYIVGNITENSNLTVQLHTLVREVGGVASTKQGFFGQISLFQSCPSCPDDRLTSYYSGVFDPLDANSTNIQFILNYRREGKHQDLEDLKEVPLNTRQQAECLQMNDNNGEFTYDGVSDPCPRKVLSVKADEKTKD